MKLQSVMATALWCLGLACVSLPAGACCTGYEWSTYNGATSTTGNMTSHRFQRHSVVTSDGAIHIIVNTGVQSSYTGSPTLTGTLQLYTSSDNGGSWTNTFTFVGTSTDGTGGAVSTDDVRLTTVGGVEYLQVAYDVEIAGGALSNALMFTALSYDPTSNTWSENSAHYPHTIESSGTTVYQQPAIAEDGNSNLWLTDLELTSVSGSGTGTIVVYERTGYYTWTALPLTITNPSLSSPYILHAPRPVFVGPDITEIGLIYQADNCLFWLTLTPTTVGPWTELSSYSNNTENENPPVCNLPDPPQELWGDTAASVATDPVSGDQYLGFVVGALTDSSVYALTYQASSGSWLNVGTVPVTIDPTTPTYVKTTFATAADSNTYAYMFVNVAGQLQFFASQTLSAGSTMYNSVDYLTHSGPGTGQSYSNPRIDAPEYITYSATSPTITTIPVWEQYTFEAGPVESLIYWKNVPISE